MRPLTAALDGDQTFLLAAVARERALDARLHRNADDVMFIRDRILRASVDQHWQEAVIEVSRLKAAIVNDQRNTVNLEQEARRARVNPGWLLP